MQLLKNVELHMSLIANQFHTDVHEPTLSDAFPQAIRSWLTYRRATLSVHQRASASAAPNASEVRNKITRSRLLTELRCARDAFVASSTHNIGVGQDVVISSVFEQM
jgi:hypothetical protein